MGSKPIELLPTTLARVYSICHPFLVLSAYIAQFSSLTSSNLLGALFNSLLPLTIIQVIYVAICLPCVGSSQKVGARKGRNQKVNAARKTSKASMGNLEYVWNMLLALALTALSIPLFTAVQILFGAPLTTHLPHTVLSSAHLSLLSLLPLIYVHGTNSKKWREIVSVYCPLDEIFGASVGAFVGGWLGAIPIPLDWDREWQKWPITVVTGMYLGNFLGNFLGGWVLKGKKIELE